MLNARKCFFGYLGDKICDALAVFPGNVHDLLERIVGPYDLSRFIEQRIRDLKIPQELFLNLSVLGRKRYQILDHPVTVMKIEKISYARINNGKYRGSYTGSYIHCIHCKSEDSDKYGHPHRPHYICTDLPFESDVTAAHYLSPLRDIIPYMSKKENADRTYVQSAFTIPG